MRSLVFILLWLIGFADTNAQWVKLNPSKQFKDPYALATSGSDTYLATALGVYRSMDYGATWTASAELSTTLVTSLLIEGSQIFGGTLSGVIVSTDNGSSWRQAGEGTRRIPNERVGFARSVHRCR